MAKIKHVTAKLGNMRKAVEWIVYPKKTNATDDSVLIQSDHRICKFDPKTGKGVLSKHCANYPSFATLNGILGATEVVVPQDVIDAAVASVPQPGDEIGPGVYIA